jgi:hypothetical protein
MMNAPGGAPARRRWIIAAFTERLPSKITALVLAIVVWAVVRGEESTEVVLYAQVAPVVEGPLEVSAIVPESVEVVVAGRKRDLFKLRSQPPVVRRRFDDAVPQRVRISLQPSDVEFPLGVQATAREVRPRIVTITLRAPGSASAPATAPGGK